jgi:cytoskeletal protein CcmA (bactofilin family)
MKFFDPKKKEPAAPPARTVNPVPPVQPAPPRPVPPPAPTPAPAPVVAPVNSNPVPNPVPSPASAPVPPVTAVPASQKTVIQEVPVPPRPVMVTEKMTPQVNFQTVIGSSLMIKGDVLSEEDILVHGFVEGTIETSGDVIVGPEGKVFANIRATNVTISGKVIGNVSASNKVNIAPTGLLQGNIRAPKLSIAEAALFRGSIDMRAETPAAQEKEDRIRKTASSAQFESVQK